MGCSRDYAKQLLLNSWLFKSEFRYRVPFDVVLIPMIVVGWDWGLKKISSTKLNYYRALICGLAIGGAMAVFVSFSLFFRSGI